MLYEVITPGELKLVYKGGPEVIRNTEQVEALRTGLIDIDYVAASYYTSIMPESYNFV